MSAYTRKINRGFQFTLPPDFKDIYHLQVGDYVRIYEENGKWIIEPVTMLPKNPKKALESLFMSSTDAFRDLSEEEIMKLVSEEIKKHRKLMKKNRDQDFHDT
jgi:bifunctional DNA-binding transcriptional regulator/antitoxin component of YhaV-PrlF toxin-antitoxin module